MSNAVDTPAQAFILDPKSWMRKVIERLETEGIKGIKGMIVDFKHDIKSDKPRLFNLAVSFEVPAKQYKESEIGLLLAPKDALDKESANKFYQDREKVHDISFDYNIILKNMVRAGEILQEKGYIESFTGSKEVEYNANLVVGGSMYATWFIHLVHIDDWAFTHISATYSVLRILLLPLLTFEALQTQMLHTQDQSIRAFISNMVKERMER